MKDDLISRQAAISEIMEDINDRSLHDDPDTSEDYAEGYDEGTRNAAAIVLQMPSLLHWIPCSERLPDWGEYYLVTKQYFGWNCTEYREIDIAKYDFNGWPKGYTVLAWCELPEPWKEEGKDGDGND